MPATSIQSPFPIFTDIDGQPLEAGLIWLGTAGNNPISSPITAYWDAALTQVVTQPVTTRGGYPLNGTAVGRLYVNADYSILVRNRSGSDVLSALNATERYDSSLVTFIQAGAGAVTRTAQAKMREVVSVKDFGAVGDGVSDDTAAIIAAMNSVDTAGGRGGTVYFPQGVYLISSAITVKDRVKFIGAGSRSTIINSNFVGAMFSFAGITNAGLIGMRLGIHSAAGTKAIDITTPGNVDCRWLEFNELEISTGSLLNNQIGISAVTSGTAIITECTFNNIKIYNVSSPLVINGPEGNFFTNLTIAEFGASAPTSAIGPAGNANIIQGRVAGTPFAGSIAYSEGGGKNIVDLIVDIGPASTAINITGTGNMIRLSRPELLTPVGSFNNSTTVIDSEFIAGNHIVSSGTTPTSSSFTLGAGFGNAATVTNISGNDQRLTFTINAAGAGMAAFPSVGYAFVNGAFPKAPIPQVTRNGGNQNTTAPGFGANASVNGWGFLFGGTPVAGESYVFTVTVG